MHGETVKFVQYLSHVGVSQMYVTLRVFCCIPTGVSIWKLIKYNLKRFKMGGLCGLTHVHIVINEVGT